MKFLILLLFSLSAFAQKIPHNMIVPYATGDITGLQAALDLKASLTSPALLGVPTAPTALPLNSSTQIATTKYVDDAILANQPVLDHGGLTGLLDDDHPQYHNDARGDARYFTQAQSNTNFEPKNSNIQAHISSTSNPHSVTKAQIGLGSVPNVDATDRASHTGTQPPSSITQDAGNRFFTDTERAKLSGVAAGATANSSDAFLLSRANHTGTQLAATISDFTSAVSAISPVQSVAGKTGAVTLNKADVGLPLVLNLDQSNPANITQSSSFRFATDAEKAIWNGKQNALGFTPENAANKTTNFTGNTGSNTLFPTVKATFDAIVGYLAAYQPLLGFTPANDSLSNLAGTSINQTLLPDTDGIYDIGASGQNWNNIRAKTIGYDGATAINLDSRKMFDNGTEESIDFEARVLKDDASLGSVQYGARALLDGGGNEALNWQSRYLADDGEVLSLDWLDRRLYASDGATPILDWTSTTGPTTVTQSPGNNSTKIATTAYVDNIKPTYIEHFGSGADGNLTLTGPLTLTQDVYYNTLTLGAGAALNTNGYRIFCKTLDLTNAPARAIRREGTNGNSTTTQAGAGLIGALVTNTLGGSANGGAGATGVVGVGAQAGASGSLVNANGGASGEGGAGGAGVSGAGGASRAASTSTTNVVFERIVYDLLRGAVTISGGAGAPGGSSGAGDGTNNGRGGGGGASGAGVIGIWAHTIITGPSTPAGVISCIGGTGGNAANGGAGNVGGGGGGGGSGGGFAYIMYAFRVGTFVANLINCSGGNGGLGGNGFGTGLGGRGGGGGQGGRITAYNVSTASGTSVNGVVGTAGGLNTGITGGIGGIGGLARMGL